MTKSKNFNLIMAAIMAAMTAILAQITIPLGLVPMTLQATGVFLMAILLGKKWGTLSAFLYAFLGAIGLPVYSGGGSGFGILFGPTGGYIFAFIVTAYLVAFLHDLAYGKLYMIFISILIGAIVMLLIGTFWLKFFTEMTLTAAFAAGFLPFIFSNSLQVIVSTLLSYTLLRRLPQSILDRLKDNK